MTTWNPSDKGSDVTLSGSDLVATVATNSRMAVRGTTSKSGGKHYFEVLVGSNQIGIGVANASAPVSNAGNSFWESTHGIALHISGGNSVITYNGADVQSGLASFTSGDVIGVAVDVTGGTIQFYKNNVALGSADANLGTITGDLYAAVGGWNSAASQIGTATFATADLTYSPPATFDAWDSLLDFTHAMTGGVSVGGEATVYPPPAHEITGGVKIGSDFTIEVRGTFIHEMTGGVKIAGDATIEETHPTPTDPVIPVGGFEWGGSAIVQENIPYMPSGGFAWGGTSVVLEKIPYLPTGGFVWGGAVTPITAYAPAVSGGFVWSGTVTPVTKYTITPSEGFEWGGTAPVTFRESLYVPSGGFIWGGTSLAYMVDADTVVTPENPYADKFPGWMVNTENNAVSRYMGLPATSITQFKGKTYITNAAGVYELDGDDDNGQPIKASIEFPTTDFQESREKRMEVAYMGVKTEGKMRVRVAVNGRAPMYFFLMPTSDTHKGTRVPIGKGLVGRYWSVRIDNYKGSRFVIESAEFKPVVQQRHGA